MDYSHVQRGQKLQIQAEIWNTFVDVAKAYKQSAKGGAGTGGSAFGDPVTVWVQNDSTARERFSVVQLGDPAVLFSENENEFKNKPVLKATTPSADNIAGRWAVIQEDLRPNQVGRAAILGLTPCKLTVVDEADTFADATNGATTPSTRAAGGSAKILWKESGTGAKWATIVMGRGVACTLPVDLAPDGGTAGSNPMDRTYKVRLQGSTVDLATNQSPVYRPTAGKAADASSGLASFYADGRYNRLEQAYESTGKASGCGGE